MRSSLSTPGPDSAGGMPPTENIAPSTTAPISSIVLLLHVCREYIGLPSLARSGSGQIKVSDLVVHYRSKFDAPRIRWSPVA
jgi:hypothetical protein